MPSQDHANLNSKSVKIVIPTAPVKSETSVGLSPARSDTVASAIQTVTATATAREPSRHNSAKTYLPVNNSNPKQGIYSPSVAANTRKTFGMKIPSVNRINGHETPLIRNLADNRPTAADILDTTEPEVLVESTEASPTTIQPLNEDEIRTELSVGEQLTLIPDLKEELLVGKETIDTKRKTLHYGDSYVANKKAAIKKPNGTGIKDSLYPNIVKEAQQPEIAQITPSVRTNTPPTFLYASTARPHKQYGAFETSVSKVEAQTSAAVVTLNALSEKDLDDYATTTPSPLTNPTTNLPEPLAINPEESTEFISVTDRVSPDMEAGDWILANLVASGIANTEISPKLEPTSVPSLREPPAIVGLYFRVLSDSSLGGGININHQSNTTLLPLKTLPSSTHAPKTSGYGININFSGSTLIPALTTTTLASTSYITSTTERTTSTSSKSIKRDDLSIQLATKPEEKRTLYGRWIKHVLLNYYFPVIIKVN